MLPTVTSRFWLILWATSRLAAVLLERVRTVVVCACVVRGSMGLKRIRHLRRAAMGRIAEVSGRDCNAAVLDDTRAHSEDCSGTRLLYKQDGIVV